MQANPLNVYASPVFTSVHVYRRVQPERPHHCRRRRRRCSSHPPRVASTRPAPTANKNKQSLPRRPSSAFHLLQPGAAPGGNHCWDVCEDQSGVRLSHRYTCWRKAGRARWLAGFPQCGLATSHRPAGPRGPRSSSRVSSRHTPPAGRACGCPHHHRRRRRDRCRRSSRSRRKGNRS